MTIREAKLAWKYRRPLWKFRKLLWHRREIAAAAITCAAILAAVLERIENARGKLRQTPPR